MILGYSIDEADLKCNMLEGLQLEECAKYSNIYDLNILDSKFRVRNKKYNVACTYDGFTIVSDKFKQFCEQEGYAGLEFTALPNEPTFYWFKIHNVVEFDTKERETEFINYNEACKGYEEIIGATPVCLKSKIPLADGFYRTNIFFGSYAGKSPVHLLGEDTKEKLKKVGFKEIVFQKILDKYEWHKSR